MKNTPVKIFIEVSDEFVGLMSTYPDQQPGLICRYQYGKPNGMSKEAAMLNIKAEAFNLMVTLTELKMPYVLEYPYVRNI
jgi:hypothetical protein